MRTKFIAFIIMILCFGIYGNAVADYTIFSNIPLIANTCINNQSIVPSAELYKTLFAQGFVLLQTIMVLFLNPQNRSTYIIQRFMDFVATLFTRSGLSDFKYTNQIYQDHRIE